MIETNLGHMGPVSASQTLDIEAALQDPEKLPDVAGDIWLKRGGGTSTKEQQDEDWEKAEAIVNTPIKDLDFLTPKKK